MLEDYIQTNRQKNVDICIFSMATCLNGFSHYKKFERDHNNALRRVSVFSDIADNYSWLRYKLSREYSVYIDKADDLREEWELISDDLFIAMNTVMEATLENLHIPMCAETEAQVKRYPDLSMVMMEDYLE